MIYSEVIVVGGGPAGSTCAWKLKQSGIECLILDKQNFPRAKSCAGWITPKVVKDLKIDLQNYPHSILSFDKFHVNVYGKSLKIKTRQYSIRRYEFDNWLIKRSGIPVYIHYVKSIKKDNAYYVMDDQYRCKYLVGAGGSYCPIYRTIFERVNPRTKRLFVVTLGEEIAYDYQDSNCYSWFFERKFPGYAWYMPKGNGYLNVGVGGLAEKININNANIKNHWNYFIQKLEDLSLVKNYHFNPKGYVYYLRDNIKVGQIENAFVIGDAAGLATKDVGEGIGPAVESGLLAAEAIINGTRYSLSSVKKYSIVSIIIRNQVLRRILDFIVKWTCVFTRFLFRGLMQLL